MAKFADILKTLRIEKGLTQQELADALHYTKSRISMYERGEREPNLDVMETIADYFNVDLDFLYGRRSRPATFVCIPCLPPANTRTDSNGNRWMV